MNETETILNQITSACHDGNYYDVVSKFLELDEDVKSNVRRVLTKLFTLSMMTPYELRTELHKESQ